MNCEHRMTTEDAMNLCELETLGEGTYGTAILYVDEDTDQKFVRKYANSVHNEELNLAMLGFEYNILKSIKDKIVGVPRVIRKQQNSFDMEYIEGAKTLYDMKKLTKQQKFSVVTQLIEIVERTHELSLYHRDIKQDNVLYVEETGKVYLIDWGNAIYDHELILSDKKRIMTFGTSMFNPPEYYLATNTTLQVMFNMGFNEDCDYRKTDVWQLGTLIFELFYDEPPFGEAKYDECLFINRLFSYDWKKDLVKHESIGVQHFFEGIFKSEDERYSLSELKQNFRRLSD
jgi:serine/threonine protein kinase